AIRDEIAVEGRPDEDVTAHHGDRRAERITGSRKILKILPQRYDRVRRAVDEIGNPGVLRGSRRTDDEVAPEGGDREAELVADTGERVLDNRQCRDGHGA